MLRFSEVIGSVGPHVNLWDQQLADGTFQEDDESVLTVLALCHPTSAISKHQHQNVKIQNCQHLVLLLSALSRLPSPSAHSFHHQQQHWICNVFV